jgi:HK97 family phage prohead protease
MSKFLITKTPVSQPRIWSRTSGGLSAGKIKEAPRGIPLVQNSILNKTVFFRLSAEGQMIAGVVSEIVGDRACVKLCLPNTDGILFMSKGSSLLIPTHDLQVVDAETVQNCDVKAYTENALVEVDKEKASEVKEGGVVVDYRDVKFDGLASTFKDVTPADRDGDYIINGAFTKWLSEFKRNPVLLSDHIRSVKNLMGHYPKVSTSEKGLHITGHVTNSPHPDARHVRFQLVEGSLKTLSIGGSFFYLQDMKGIEEIRLHEISLVVIPANPDAVVVTRAISGEHAEKAFKMHAQHNGGDVRSGIKMKNA